MICVSNFIVLPIKVDTTEGLIGLGKQLIFVLSEYFLVMELASVLASIPCPYLTAASEKNTMFSHYILSLIHPFTSQTTQHKYPVCFDQDSFVLLWFFLCLLALAFFVLCCFSKCQSLPNPCVTSESLGNVLSNGTKPCVWLFLSMLSSGLGNSYTFLNKSIQYHVTQEQHRV